MLGVIKANIFEDDLREKIVKLALLQYHKLYEHGKNGLDTFDCAGLVWFVFFEVFGINLYDGGIGLSTTTKIMTNNYGKLTLFEKNDTNKDLSIIKKGDIIFFHRQAMGDNAPRCDNKYPGHCGIYLEDNCFIHCSRPKGKVIISNFDNNRYWKQVLVASKDICSDNKVLKMMKK